MSYHVVGSLLELRSGGDVFAPFLQLKDLEISAPTPNGWRSAELFSRLPLIERDADATGGKFKYRFLFLVSSTSRVLVASTHVELLDHILKATKLKARVEAPAVKVSALMETLTRDPGEYMLSALYSRIEDQGQSLRSMTLFGADLASSRVFRDLIPHMSPYRATMRDPVRQDDVLTIGSRGDVAFMFRGATSLSRVTRALRWLRTHNLILWPGEDHAGT